MNKLIQITLLLCFLSAKAFTQITFEKGYFINNSSQRIECLIKNVDWLNNPSDFAYKMSENDSAKRADISNVKEFNVGMFNYVSAKVEIDRSSSVVGEMNQTQKPIFKEETLFLRKIVDGKASLFLYRDNNLVRFFYATDSSAIKQLVFKHYVDAKYTDEIYTNNYFRQQILNDFRSHGVTFNELKDLKYSEKDLKSLFNKLNGEKEEAIASLSNDKTKRDKFNLLLRPGLNFGDVEIKKAPYNSWERYVGFKINFRLGIEFEYILPFNKNKWSLFIEPTYQYYKAETTKELHINNTYTQESICEVDYKSIELPIGVRHYFFLNDHSKIFINASLVLDFAQNSTIEFSIPSVQSNIITDIKSLSNFFAGIGYKYKNRISLEMQYHFSREFTNSFTLIAAKYHSYSLVFGYSLF